MFSASGTAIASRPIAARAIRAWSAALVIARPKTVTNEVVTAEELGGASVHATKSAVADGAFENDLDCLLQIADLSTSCRPIAAPGSPNGPPSTMSNGRSTPLDTLIPENRNKPYDIKELILKVVDEGDFFELSVSFARNMDGNGMGDRGKPNRPRPASGEARLADGRHAGLGCAHRRRGLPRARGQHDGLDRDQAAAASRKPADSVGAGRPVRGSYTPFTS